MHVYACICMYVCVRSGLEGKSTTRHSKMAEYLSLDDQDNGANEKKSRVIICIAKIHFFSSVKDEQHTFGVSTCL